MKIYLVAFGPSDNSPHGTGGFDWNISRDEAVKRVREHLEVSGFDFIYREIEVPNTIPVQDPEMSVYLQCNVEMP